MLINVKDNKFKEKQWKKVILYAVIISSVVIED